MLSGPRFHEHPIEAPVRSQQTYVWLASTTSKASHNKVKKAIWDTLHQSYILTL